MKLVLLAAAWGIAAAAPPAAAPAPIAPAEPAAPAKATGFNPTTRNVHLDRPGCVSVLRQVQEQSKHPAVRGSEARTLDLEPPAHLLSAVDRQVGGCREVTFVRRNAARGTNMPNGAPAPR